MAVITLNEINRKFEQLLSKDISLEDAANCALQLQEQFDNKALEFVPVEHEKKIWDAILFLEGTDLQVSPGSYLYDLGDVQEYKSKKL